jgi:hypothetical protein
MRNRRADWNAGLLLSRVGAGNLKILRHRACRDRDPLLRRAAPGGGQELLGNLRVVAVVVLARAGHDRGRELYDLLAWSDAPDRVVIRPPAGAPLPSGGKRLIAPFATASPLKVTVPLTFDVAGPHPAAARMATPATNHVIHVNGRMLAPFSMPAFSCRVNATIRSRPRCRPCGRNREPSRRRSRCCPTRCESTSRPS